MISLTEAFGRCKAHNHTALMPYLTAGYPDEKTFLRLLDEFAGAGADMIEIGIPFSDPLADGPVIQYASQQALAGGMTLEKTLRLLRAANNDSTASRIVMSYINPLRAYGLARFAAEARRAGISGLIIPDLTWDEGKKTEQICHESGIDLIYLLAPTSAANRRQQIIKRSRGFVYLVSVTGVTGARRALPPNLLSWIKQVKKESPLPVCVGFGISNPGQAREVSRCADGVIIGSAIIEIIRKAGSPRRIVNQTGAFIRRLRKGIDHV